MTTPSSHAAGAAQRACRRRLLRHTYATRTPTAPQDGAVEGGIGAVRDVALALHSGEAVSYMMIGLRSFVIAG